MQEWLANPPDGTVISLGFDGSENNDWSALKACTMGGMVFTPRYGASILPSIWNPAEWGGETPRGEIHAAVDEMFTRFTVARFYADPFGYYSEIGEWHRLFGDAVFEFPTNKISRMFPAIQRFRTDLANGAITHDGCPLTNTSMGNARKVAKPAQMYLLGKEADHRKIDPTMGAILAYEAMCDAKEAGFTDVKVSTGLIRFAD